MLLKSIDILRSLFEDNSRAKISSHSEIVQLLVLETWTKEKAWEMHMIQKILRMLGRWKIQLIRLDSNFQTMQALLRLCLEVKLLKYYLRNQRNHEASFVKAPKMNSWIHKNLDDTTLLIQAQIISLRQDQNLDSN